MRCTIAWAWRNPPNTSLSMFLRVALQREHGTHESMYVFKGCITARARHASYDMF
ncbi:Uncharacterized protein TCM_026427 [Theobroma cacao]|uniref:Uncharacterized protein n=1 Tax=Theobroma cacao TaxID=3641 RepID=A0A061F9M1_THECC|nr:Uncharacterized protein TCM_026427 [Theobroma cacao]